MLQLGTTLYSSLTLPLIGMGWLNKLMLIDINSLEIGFGNATKASHWQRLLQPAVPP